MKKSVIILLPLIVAFRPLPEKFRGHTSKEIAQRIDQVKVTQSSTRKMPTKKSSDSSKKLEKELERLRNMRDFSPSFDNEFGTISTFERFRGVIDGNIISSGHPVTFKVSFLHTRKIPRGSYLSCTGTNLAAKYNYRIIASCDRLITAEAEYKVSVGIKDLKKVDGIEPDHIYTGDEEAIIGEGFSAIMSGIIDARKERVQTAIGFSETPTLKNAYLTGLVNAAKMANQKAREHTSQRVVVLAAQDKKEVIIEFKRGFSYEKNSEI